MAGGSESQLNLVAWWIGSMHVFRSAFIPSVNMVTTASDALETFEIRKFEGFSKRADPHLRDIKLKMQSSQERIDLRLAIFAFCFDKTRKC